MWKEREKELKAFKLMIDEAAFFDFKALQKHLKHCYSFPILPHAPLSSTWPDLVVNRTHWAVNPCWSHQKSQTMPHLLNLGRLSNRQLFPILPAGLASDFISSYSLLDGFPVAVPRSGTTTDYRGRGNNKVFWNVSRISMANHFRGHFARTSTPWCLALVLYL